MRSTMLVLVSAVALGDVVPMEVKLKKPETLPDRISREDLLREIRAHRKQVAACYEVEVAKDPKLAGRFTLEFSVSPEGRVEHATPTRVQGLTQTVVACVVKSAGEWQFPKAKSGLHQVTFPFDFKPGEWVPRLE